jgi:hypothetical protein
MTVNHPIITYRLTRDGRIPEFLCKHEGAFGGMYGVNTNKPGYIAKWPSPQETQFLGMGDGPLDPDGGFFSFHILSSNPIFHLLNAVWFSPTGRALAWAPTVIAVDNAGVNSVFKLKSFINPA